MTEEYQAASLVLCEWAVWVAAANAAVSAVVGGAQCFIVWRGLRLMEQDLERRIRRQEEWRRESERRHAERMRALEAGRSWTVGGRAEPVRAPADDP